MSSSFILSPDGVTEARLFLAALILFAKSSSGQTCYQTPFPIFIGGTSGNTALYAIDYHGDSDQVVTGGYLEDGGISNSYASSSLTVPIIVMYSGGAFTYTWGVYVEVPSTD